MVKKKNILHRNSRQEHSGTKLGPSVIISTQKKMKVRIKDSLTEELCAEFEIPSQHKVDIELEWQVEDDISIIKQLNGVILTNEQLNTCADCWSHKLKNLR